MGEGKGGGVYHKSGGRNFFLPSFFPRKFFIIINLLKPKGRV
jgi:hypothetical protein